MASEVVETVFELGDWARFTDRSYGRVASVYMDGSIMVVMPDGHKVQLNHDAMTVGSPEQFMAEIQAAAAAIGWTEDELAKHHAIIAENVGLGLYALETLDKLSEAIDDVGHTNGLGVQGMSLRWDSKGVEFIGPDATKRVTLKQLEKEIKQAEIDGNQTLLEFLSEIASTVTNPEINVRQANIDPTMTEVMAAFLSQEPAKPPRSRGKKETAEPSGVPAPAPPPEVTAEASAAYEDIFGCAPQATEKTADQAEASYNAVWNTIEESSEVAEEDIFGAFGMPVSDAPEIPKSGDAEPATEQEPAAETAAPAASAPALAPIPVRTDAGLTDPETGELLEKSFIMEKLGWVKMPELPKNPTVAELDAFEAKINQVGDRMVKHMLLAAHWRNQTELKCEPFDKAADFWWTNFVKPMSDLLGPHRLPKITRGERKGEYREKTMHLSSCSIQFTKSGGYYQHDADAIRKHIQEKGVQNFPEIDAEVAVKYDWQKLMDVLGTEKYKDFPGTGHRPKNEFAKAELKIPMLSASKKKNKEEVSVSEGKE